MRRDNETIEGYRIVTVEELEALERAEEENMTKEALRKILSEEYVKIGHHDSSVSVLEGNLAPIDRAAIAAMRRAYQAGKESGSC